MARHLAGKVFRREESSETNFRLFLMPPDGLAVLCLALLRPHSLASGLEGPPQISNPMAWCPLGLPVPTPTSMTTN